MRHIALPLPSTTRVIRWPLWRVALGVAALALLTVVVGTHPGRTAVRTLFFLPEMFPSPLVRPLTWISAAPRCDELTIPYADTAADSDVCYPPGAGQRGGIVMTLGVHPLDRHDPFLVRLTDALARMQIVVLRPESPDLTAGRIVPREIDGLVAAYQTLEAEPYVDPRRVGFVGFSVGGSVATVAAADPRIRDRVRLVNSFGAYYDPFSVLHAVASARVHYDGVDQEWTPHPWSVHVFAEQLVATMPPGDERDYLAAVLEDAEAAGPPPAPLTPLGQHIYGLVVEGEPVDGDALLAVLPAETRDVFIGVSPAAHVADLRATMYVMHDVGDTLIPYTESRALVAHLPPDVPREYVEFHIFQHVTPRSPAELLGFLPELVTLYQHLYMVFLVLTE
jgi:hypothetical protein